MATPLDTLVCSRQLDSRLGSRFRTATALLAAVVVAAWIASLSRNLFAPMCLDHACYQFTTERVLAGQDLYRDFYHVELPGMIAIHSLATWLFGPSFLGLRLLDAVWQGLTLTAMVTLGGRDGGRWRTGWLAALLYIWAYYGFGFAGTAQREGFAVLPLLLAIHLLLPTRRTERSPRWLMILPLLAGLMCSLAYAIKPTLGLCYGAFWIRSLYEAWTQRHQGKRCLAGLVGLTGGFVLGTAAVLLAIATLGWWPSYWTMLTHEPVSRQTLQGPWMIRIQLPRLVLAVVILAVWVGLELAARRRHGDPVSTHSHSDWLRWTLLGTGLFGLLLTMVSWPGWYVSVLRVSGLVIPVVGAVLACSWRDRSVAWRLSLLLVITSVGGLFLLGRFSGCRFAGVVAFAAYPAANEIAERCRLWPRTGNAGSGGLRAWAMVCIVCVIHLGICHWGDDLTRHSTSIYVLSNSTLDDYRARFTEGIPVSYLSELKVAKRVRELTGDADAIGILFGDPRLYLMCGRPAVHRLIWPRPGSGWYPRERDEAFMNALVSRRPKLLIDRLPHDSTATSAAIPQIEQALFREMESRYGQAARAVRANYHVAEVIDNICILMPSSAGIQNGQ